MIKEIDLQDLASILGQGAKLVDVRESEELEDGVIPGHIHMPLSVLEEFETDLKALGPKILFYCRSGKRSLKAAEMAQDWGIGPDLFSLRGGFLEYERNRGKDNG